VTGLQEYRRRKEFDKRKYGGQRIDGFDGGAEFRVPQVDSEFDSLLGIA